MEDGRRLLKQFFDDNPTRKLWVPRILDDKGKVNKTGEGLAHKTNYDTGEVYLAYNLSMSYNYKKYFNYYAPRLVTLLDKIAHKSIKVETSCKATLKDKLFGKGHLFVTDCEEKLSKVGKVESDFFAVRVLVKESKNKKKLSYRSFILEKNAYENLFEDYEKANLDLIVQVQLMGTDGSAISSDWNQINPKPRRYHETGTGDVSFCPLISKKGEGIKASDKDASPRLRNTTLYYDRERCAPISTSEFSVVEKRAIWVVNKEVSDFYVAPYQMIGSRAWARYGVHRRDVILTADELKSLKKIKARILSPSDVGL